MCIYCRDVDMLCRHDAPAVSADGRGYRIDAGPPVALLGALAGPAALRYDGNGGCFDAAPGLPLAMHVANLAEQVRAQYGRIVALEVALGRMQERERESREP